MPEFLGATKCEVFTKKLIWKLLGKKIILNGQTLRLPFPVTKAVELPGLLIVLLDPPRGTIYSRNVMAMRMDGTIAWQIEESPHGGDMDQPYVDITQDNHGNVIARNWNGVEYQVDLASGAIETVGFRRF